MSVYVVQYFTHVRRSKITWAHGNLLFHSGKKRSRHSKISVSSKGCVKIKKIEQYDEGVYTCMGESPVRPDALS